MQHPKFWFLLQLVIFNHPENVQSLLIQDGSGFFEVGTLSGNKIVQHKYNPTTQAVAISPLVTGETMLTVRDLCLVRFKVPL